jgi:hypothetical protein
MRVVHKVQVCFLTILLFCAARLAPQGRKTGGRKFHSSGPVGPEPEAGAVIVASTESVQALEVVPLPWLGMLGFIPLGGEKDQKI